MTRLLQIPVVDNSSLAGQLNWTVGKAELFQMPAHFRPDGDELGSVDLCVAKSEKIFTFNESGSALILSVCPTTKAGPRLREANRDSGSASGNGGRHPLLLGSVCIE